QVQLGRTYVDVPHEGRQQGQLGAQICPLAMPSLDAMHREAVAEGMHVGTTRSSLRSDPYIAQDLIQDRLQGDTAQSALARRKEIRITCSLPKQWMSCDILLEGSSVSWSERQHATLSELALPDSERMAGKIDIFKP